MLVQRFPSLTKPVTNIAASVGQRLRNIARECNEDFALASVVLSHRSSLAQDEPEVECKVLSKVAPTYPDLARKTNVLGAVNRNCARW